MMNVLQIVPHIGNEASGPSYSCVRLGQALADAGEEVLLMSVKGSQLPPCGRFHHRVYPKSTIPSFLWRSPALYRGLLEHSRSADILHTNSLWLMPNVYPGWAARATNKPLVISPRGTLSDWAWTRSRFKKRLFWSALQRSVVEQAVMLHATCEAEFDEI